MVLNGIALVFSAEGEVGEHGVRSFRALGFQDVSVSVSEGVCVYIYIYICVCVCVCLFVCLFVCL